MALGFLSMGIVVVSVRGHWQCVFIGCERCGIDGGVSSGLCGELVGCMVCQVMHDVSIINRMWMALG